MQGRRLTISRGLTPVPETAGPTLVPQSARPVGPTAPAPDFCLVHHRLAALERLSVLRDKGALSAEEFAAEKALVLRLPAEELMLAPEGMLPPRGPSLLGRLLSWKLLAAGIVGGLCLSAYTAPRDLMILADQAARLIG
jgi:putative oligomerization/nucleic acid binding protein